VASDQTLLAEIERDLLDGRPLADLLRKCIMLGGRSGSQALRDWASQELRGYDGTAELPSYRKVAAPILIDATTGNAWIRGQHVPASSLPDFAREAGLGNNVDLRQGVGELETLAANSRNSDTGIRVGMPGGEVIGQYFDRSSGNPFQHTDRIYWSVSPTAIHGAVDNVRTTLTELITELIASVPRGQEVPTAEQANQAWNVAVNGGESHFHIAAPVTAVQASGRSSIEGVTGSQAGVAEGNVRQTATYNGTQTDAVRAWLDEYRAVLSELDEALQAVAQLQLNQVAAEVEKPEPQPAVVNGLLGSLRSFAQNAIASAGAGAGTIGLTEVVAHWPFQ
jgi:hypothetical protein